MNRFLRFCIPALLLTLNVMGCEHAQSNLPVVSMKIGNRTFNIEIARSDRERETGLMRRDSMPADHGMIFVFDEDEIRGFWMKNTRISLDILYIDVRGTVVSVKQMDAYDERETKSDQPYRYAIELNKGAAADAGVKVGDKIAIPPEALAKGK